MYFMHVKLYSSQLKLALTVEPGHISAPSYINKLHFSHESDVSKG